MDAFFLWPLLFVGGNPVLFIVALVLVLGGMEMCKDEALVIPGIVSFFSGLALAVWIAW